MAMQMPNDWNYRGSTFERQTGTSGAVPSGFGAGTLGTRKPKVLGGEKPSFDAWRMLDMGGRGGGMTDTAATDITPTAIPSVSGFSATSGGGAGIDFGALAPSPAVGGASPIGPTAAPQVSMSGMSGLQTAAAERGAGPGMAELSAVGSLAGALGQRMLPRMTPALSVLGRKAY